MIVELNRAVELIKQGEVVAFPTETVYGLGADAFNLQAINKTFEVKGRPSDNPLIVHISNDDQVNQVTSDLPESFYILKDIFWPGPLTMILNKSKKVPDKVTGGLQTVAVRMPAHPLALKLIEQTGPLTAPSANRSGRPSPTKPEHLIQDYGEEIYILDGGATEIGLESTIVDLTVPTPEVLRPGAITAIQIGNALGCKVLGYQPKSSNDQKPVKSPGLKYTHYKPKAEVAWLTEKPEVLDSRSIYVFHSKIIWPENEQVFQYHNNFNRLARDLYDIFRTADNKNFNNIYIEQLPDTESHTMIQALSNRIAKAIGNDI